ncbi:MAG TPA: hypothetical protein VHY80_08340, partial [Stellaceae bacterium]|nr:hypothetical protein [Stellaceae bacterium]
IEDQRRHTVAILTQDQGIVAHFLAHGGHLLGSSRELNAMTMAMLGRLAIGDEPRPAAAISPAMVLQFDLSSATEQGECERHQRHRARPRPSH